MPSVRKNISATRAPNRSMLSALAVCCLAQAFVCTMASATGPTLRPIPESAQKSTNEKPEATSKTPAGPAQKPLSAVAKPLAPAKADALTKPVVAKPLLTTTGSAPMVVPPVTIKSMNLKPITPIVHTKPRVSRPAMVPPPPPNTPSILSDPSIMGMGYGAYGMQVEYMSREALKDRVKELSIQVKDASAEFENRKRLKLERDTRAKSFEQLFAEGVVSRRELENSQREATDSTDEVQRLERKYNELINLLERVNKRLAAFPQPPGKKSNQKAQQKLKKSQAKANAPAKQQIKAADSKLIN